MYIGTSLDGFIARSDGRFDFLEVARVQEIEYGYKAFSASVDCLVIGRGTYDVVLGFADWPYPGKRVIVLTHRTQDAPRHGEELVSVEAGELPAFVERLAREGVQRAYLDGGNVIRQFLAADLVDDVTISVMPVLIGAGISLFAAADGQPRTQHLTLDSTQAWPETGVVQLRYRRPSRAE